MFLPSQCTLIQPCQHPHRHRTAPSPLNLSPGLWQQVLARPPGPAAFSLSTQQRVQSCSNHVTICSKPSKSPLLYVQLSPRPHCGPRHSMICTHTQSDLLSNPDSPLFTLDQPRDPKHTPASGPLYMLFPPIQCYSLPSYVHTACSLTPQVSSMSPLQRACPDHSI